MPALSAVNDCATSGALPPRMAAMILSSLTPPTILTVDVGVLRLERRDASLKTFSSALREADPQRDVRGL